MTLDQRVLNLIKKYMEKLFQKKVLTSMEEVAANTNETNLVAAPVVAELNDKLGNCSLEQEGNDFYIVGADAVRKKLGKQITLGYQTIAVSNVYQYITVPKKVNAVCVVSSSNSYGIAGFYSDGTSGASANRTMMLSISVNGNRIGLKHTYDNTKAYTVYVWYFMVE